jgi:hypothetical protein
VGCCQSLCSLTGARIDAVAVDRDVAEGGQAEKKAYSEKALVDAVRLLVERPWALESMDGRIRDLGKANGRETKAGWKVEKVQLKLEVEAGKTFGASA